MTLAHPDSAGTSGGAVSISLIRARSPRHLGTTRDDDAEKTGTPLEVVPLSCASPGLPFLLKVQPFVLKELETRLGRL